MSRDKRRERGTLPRITRNKGRRLQRAAPSGRKLFDAGRKEVFLDFFTGTANLSWAAREAGVHYRTVLRHRATDAAFGEAYDLAEAQSVPRLRAWLVEADEERKQRLADAALGSGAEDGPSTGSGRTEEDEAGGNPAPARLTVEQALQFLRDHELSQARRERAARMGPGRGNGRPVSVASNEEVREALIKGLRVHGIRVRQGTVTRDCPASAEGPEPSAERAAPITPPPRFTGSPSPSELGEDES